MVVRRTCDHSLSDRSDLHLSELERVFVTAPSLPVDSVSVSGVVRTAEVEGVEIGIMAVGVPPGAFETLGTVAGINVVVVVKR